MQISSNNSSSKATGSDEKKAKKGNFLVYARNDRNPLAQRIDQTGPVKTNVILMEIFENLGSKDLLSCSLVNQAWCMNARSILRNKRKSLAWLRGIFPCREYRELSKLVRTSSNIPFNGIVIRTQWKNPGAKDSNEYLELDVDSTEECDFNSPVANGSEVSLKERNVEDQIEEIATSTHKCLELPINCESSAFFQKVELRFLELDWKQVINCQIETIIKVFLTKNVSRLVELKVTRLPPTIPSLRTFLDILEGNEKNWLPEVQIMDLPPDVDTKAVGSSVRRELVEASPNLLSLLGVNRYPDLDFFLERYLTFVMKEFDFYYVFRNDKLVIDYKNYSLLNLVRTKPKLEKFFVTVEFNKTSLGDKIHLLLSFLGLILECSKMSLTELLVNQYQLFLLMFIHVIQPMPKVQKLHLGINCFSDCQTDVKLLKHIRWEHYFPDLKVVKIFLTNCQDGILPCATVPLEQLGEVQTCSTVTQLILRQSQKRNSENARFRKNLLDLMKFLRHLLPNVKCVTLERFELLEQYLKEVWVIWPNMEQLSLVEVDISSMQNLDTVFCGISENDAQLLQCKSANELRNLKFKPEMPCIISMPNLRKLRVEFTSHQSCQGKPDVSHLFFASRVTGLLAFTRQPTLRVEMVKRVCGIQCWYQLKHLESFVRFVNE